MFAGARGMAFACRAKAARAAPAVPDLLDGPAQEAQIPTALEIPSCFLPSRLTIPQDGRGLLGQPRVPRRLAGAGAPQPRARRRRGLGARLHPEGAARLRLDPGLGSAVRSRSPRAGGRRSQASRLAGLEGPSELAGGHCEGAHAACTLRKRGGVNWGGADIDAVLL
eukprot:7036030-Alexandrium_andersonii.AAC.1